MAKERRREPQRELRVLKLSSDSDDEEDDSDEDEIPSEPEGSCLWQKASALHHNPCWGKLVMVMIVVNITLMAVEAQYPQVRHKTKRCALLELLFVVFFTFEIGLRIFVQGCRGFFCNEDKDEKHWNWGDFVIVALGMSALVIRPNKKGLQAALMSSDDDEWTSCLLLLRGMRIIRVIRLFKELRQLHMLIRGMFKSFYSVFWILVLGLLIILFFAVSVTTIVGNHSDLWSQERCSFCEPGDQERIEELFGDLGDSMWTMFQFVTLDDWSGIIQLVSKRMWVMKFFFLAYTLIASFALISLLTGVMAEHIMSESHESCKANSDEDIAQYIDCLQLSFVARESANTPHARAGRGLTLPELTELLSEPQVAKSLKRLGLDKAVNAEDVRDAFGAMDLDGDGMLTWEEFNRGLKRISGSASARELALVRADVQRMLRLAQRTVGGADPQKGAPLMEDVFARRFGSLEERMGRLEGAVLQLAQAQTPKQGAQVSWQPPAVRR